MRYRENEAFITRLILLMEKHLGELDHPVDIKPITTGKFNSTYFIGSGAKQYVLRIAPPDDWGFIFYEEKMMRREPMIHDLIRSQTRVPVPAILAFDRDRDLIDRDFLIMERLPGEALTNVEVSEKQLDHILARTGDALAQVHKIIGPGHGYPPGGTRTPPLKDNWNETFFELWEMMVDDNIKTGGYSPEEGAVMKSALEKSARAFDREVPPSLLHMDVWHQNILVDDNRGLSGLVDWDRALWGDPEIEFAVLDYCGISRPAFWEGYGAERDDSNQAGIRTLFYLLYEIQKYIVIHRTRRFDPAAANACKSEVFRLAVPLLR